jgi:hypothetical protein
VRDFLQMRGDQQGRDGGERSFTRDGQSFRGDNVGRREDVARRFDGSDRNRDDNFGSWRSWRSRL